MSKAEQIEVNHQWYAIRVTYSREMVVKRYLDGCGVANFIPMRQIEQESCGKKHKIKVPLIHNLIFISTTAENLKRIKAEATLPIRYIMDREAHVPIVIPERQMQDFIAVVETMNEHVEIITPQNTALLNGDPVRVTGGPFGGIRGVYIRHKGHNKVAVELSGVATALTAYVPTQYIEKMLTPQKQNAFKKKHPSKQTG